MDRNPVVAGRFYQRTPDSLQDEIKRFVDAESPKERVIGMVSPHAGYFYSGPVAGATFSRVKFTDTFVVMGPNHTGRGAPFSIMTQGTWNTPLGKVDIDTGLGREILKHSLYLEEDVEAHLDEHSIEVQLPFLQYFKRDVRIVPIVLTHADGTICKEIGKSIAHAIRESQKEVVIISSSDMTHYEPHEVAKRKDMEAIEAILDLDADELLKRVKHLNITMCGYAPTISLITATKALGAREAKLVQYQTSGDASGDYSSVVGYAGVIIK